MQIYEIYRFSSCAELIAVRISITFLESRHCEAGMQLAVNDGALRIYAHYQGFKKKKKKELPDAWLERFLLLLSIFAYAFLLLFFGNF